MNIYLRLFLQQYLSVVLAALVPVILIAFLTIPVSLGGHPGEERSADAPIVRHMT